MVPVGISVGATFMTSYVWKRFDQGSKKRSKQTTNINNSKFRIGVTNKRLWKLKSVNSLGVNFFE